MFKRIILTLLIALLALSASLAIGCGGNNPANGSESSFIESPTESSSESNSESSSENPDQVREVECRLEIADDVIAVAAGDECETEIAEFTFDGENADKTLLEYSSSDENVFTVDENGIISAIGAGTAYVTASFQGVTAKTRVEVGVSRDSLKKFSEEAVKIHGRHVKNSDGKLVFDNVNSGIELWFFGTEFKVAFDVPKTTSTAAGLTQYGFLRVYLDDDIKYGYTTDIEELNVAGRRVALDKSGDGAVYTLASGLDEGYHRIQILKASEQRLNGDTRWVVSSLISDENCLVITAKESKKSIKIDFYGDSISCGAGNLGENSEHIYNTNGDGTKTYASFTARALNADSSVVSKSGLCVSAELVGKDLSLEKCWDNVSIHNNEKTEIDPDTNLVVINLGTNDFSDIYKGNSTYADLTAGIVRTLTAMKKKYTNAKFVWCYGLMNEVPDVKNAIVSALGQMGGEESGFYYVTLTVDTSGGATHPTVNGHIASARVLTDFIKNKGLI